MYRSFSQFLKSWKDKSPHKPLMVRGARQVGKSHLIRAFGKEYFEGLLEINFEKNPEFAKLFDGDPNQILTHLEVQVKTKVTPGKTLLFLDEIQFAPQLISKLRFFYEDLPELHVIAAGSLLEFVLSDHDFSMPVGRIEYLHMGPMTFEEFLLAQNEKQLVDFLKYFDLPESIPEPIHKKLMGFVKTFFIIGGMPESVKSFVQDKSFAQSDIAKSTLLQTFEDDFPKYGKRIDKDFVRKVYQKIPLEIGQKVKYVRFSEEAAYKVANALEVLDFAKICNRVFHSASNGVPLGAEIKPKDFKLYFLDVGLVASATGINVVQLDHEIELINKGKLSEQFVAQHLLYQNPPYQKPSLFYWNRQQRNSNAEIDFVISLGPHVIPVEVKSGKTGSLKSLQMFLIEKKGDLAVRFNSDLPSLTMAQVSLLGIQKDYQLLSLPFYLIGELTRLLSDVLDERAQGFVKMN